MPLIQPAVALSTRQEAFHNHYHDKIQVNMSFHDMPQQPARPAGVVPDGAKQPAPARHADRPRFSRQARCALCLPRARAIRRANRAGADTRPRPHANARDKGSLQTGPERRMNTSRTREPPPCPFPTRPSPPPHAGKPSASATMTKHELICHSMTRRNSPPVQPASSRTPGVIPAGAQRTGPHRQATRPRRPATQSRSPASAAAGTASTGSKGPAPSTRSERPVSPRTMTKHDIP